MTRQLAEEILQKYLTNKNLYKHCLAAEAAMRGLAKYFGEDVDKWGITGLLHDADYELCKGHPEKHGKLLFEKEPNVIPSDVEYAIKAHNYQNTHVMPHSKLDWSITCADQLTGLIVACALMAPEKKIANVDVEFVTKKLEKKKFAAGADRTQIYLCTEKLGIPLPEFISIVLTAMQGIHESLEL